ncbi:HAD hydrolase-like protein [candidate division KSB1 bacterium]|nr:HAD hydrolase-like protein [candidate division KSB1 bacterium]
MDDFSDYKKKQKEKQKIKMKCLIIAAGRGSRLSTRGDSKPLIPLLGLSLIERVILTAKKSGLTDFFVVTGYKGKKVRQHLNRFSQSRNINITHIIKEDWEKGNGISVLKAKELLNENFILLMGDHVFDESILVRLKNERILDGKVVLAVDYNIKTNNLVDVTKVLVEDNRILDIGKNIKKYNAYDTGNFLCSPAIFSAIEESLSNGNDSLSSGMGVMAEKGKVKAIDIKNSYWVEVNTKNDCRKAAKLLYGESIKPAGPITRYINATFATRIFTPLLLKIYKKFTPNQVSILSFVVAIISSLSFVLSHAITGGLLIQLSSILDYSDGQISRIKHMESRFGHFIDTTLDRYDDGFILLGMFYYSLSQIGSKEILGIYWSPLIISSISILAIIGNLMVSYTSATSVVNFGYVYKRRWIAAGRGRDIRLFLLFVGGIMSYFHPIFVLLALFIMALQTNIIVIWRIILSWNYYNKEGAFRMMRRIKAIIFDFDGTVANTMPFLTELAVNLITENYNISKEDAERKYLETTGLDFASQLGTIFPDNPSNQKVAAIFEESKLRGVFDHPLFPDVIPTLDHFRKKKIKMFVCSSTKQRIITKYGQLNKIDDLMDNLFGYEPGFKKGDQIDFILQHYKLRPDEVVFVADSLRDHGFAEERKLNFIGISKIFEKKEFQNKGALSVSSLNDLRKLFDTSYNYLKYVEKVR